MNLKSKVKEKLISYIRSFKMWRMARRVSWKREWKRRIKKLSLRRKGYSSPKKVKLIRTLAMAGMVSVVAGVLVFAVIFAWYAKDLPRPDRVVRREGFATQILDRNGKQLWDVFGEQKRIPIELEDVPVHLQQAVIAIEDKDFYKHEGFDPLGMVRGFSRILTRGYAQGGSTLTQQLVKNVLLTSERSVVRKIKEFALAVQIERKFSKDEILQMYLNEAPFGGTAWGVQAAAETYFSKNVRDLTLVESAILAGLPQRPSTYSPFGSNPDAYKGRTENVLRRMREDGYITKEQEEEALGDLENIEFARGDTSIKAPHFVMYVRDQLSEMYGERMVEQGGLTVTTSLDLELQEKAQDIVYEEIEKVESIEITNGAAMVVEPMTGEILAMVGSKDFFAEDYDGQVNVALSLRQPGSSIKPVTYAAALNKGYTAATPIMDVRTEFPGKTREEPYVPVNYDGLYHGPLQLRYALGSSINVPAVKLLQLIGLEEMMSLGHEMGFSTLAPTLENMRRFGLSVTLGGGEVRLIEMVTAYSAFSNGGYAVEPVAILEVKDRDGKKLFEKKPVSGKRVLSPEVAFIINDILTDNNARLITFGENSLINLSSRNIAVKTGTTNDQRDNWTVGWTNGTAVVGVWVGNNDNSPMQRVASGVSGAAPIWRRIFLEVLESRDYPAFEVPSGVEQQSVDSVSGYPAHDDFPSRTEYFVKGTVPSGADPIHSKLKVCRSSGKLATKAQIANGDYEEKEYFIFKAPEVLASGDRESWQAGIDAWIEGNGDERYHPPTELCEGGDEMVVRVQKPEDKQRIDSNEISMEVEVYSNSEVDWVKIIVDNSVRDTLYNKPFKTTMFLENGRHTLKFKARNKSGREADSGEVRIGVNSDWQEEEEPSPTPTLTPTPTPEED